MNAYCRYMDRQVLSPTAHAKLLALEAPAKRKAPARHKAPWMAYGSLAAALLLAVGLGFYGLRGGAAPGPQPPTLSLVTPSQDPAQEDQSGHSFVAQGPENSAKLMFPNVHAVDYADVSGQPELAFSIARTPGSFDVELTREDILKIFWGPEGKPQPVNRKADTGDFPLFLMNWQGYEISGTAMYNEKGELWQLNIYGECEGDSFTLMAAPGHIPPTCCVESGAVVTKVIDTEVSGWYRSYDQDGDGALEHVCTSEFLVNGVGYRFENVNAGGMRAGEDQATDLGGAQLFNAMVVNHFCRSGAFYLDDLAHCDDIPAWREEKFEALEQARAEEKFAPYLPVGDPVTFGLPSHYEFEGRLSYHQERYDRLSVRWSRGYDDIVVTAWLPEGQDRYPQSEATVDVSVPASYDWRLYDGPICDTVPQEYQMDFYMPTFRAEDMSLEVVKARGHEKDTGGTAYCFRVRHDNGVVVDYDCSAVPAEYVWSLVEATL